MAIAPGGATVAATVVEGRVGIGVGAVVAVAVAPAVGEDVEAVPTAPEAVGPARLDAAGVALEQATVIREAAQASARIALTG
jgi:hypothetical protein